MSNDLLRIYCQTSTAVTKVRVENGRGATIHRQSSRRITGLKLTRDAKNLQPVTKLVVGITVGNISIATAATGKSIAEEVLESEFGRGGTDDDDHRQTATATTKEKVVVEDHQILTICRHTSIATTEDADRRSITRPSMPPQRGRV